MEYHQHYIDIDTIHKSIQISSFNLYFVCCVCLCVCEFISMQFFHKCSLISHHSEASDTSCCTCLPSAPTFLIPGNHYFLLIKFCHFKTVIEMETYDICYWGQLFSLQLMSWIYIQVVTWISSWFLFIAV